MAKNITLMGADYPQVPAVALPQTGGGTATFYDINVIDSLDSDSSTDALSAKQGKKLNESKISYVTGYVPVWMYYTTFINTTKAAVESTLRASIGQNFVVFACLSGMSDGTENGIYLVTRNGTYSGTTRFIKLGT